MQISSRNYLPSTLTTLQTSKCDSCLASHIQSIHWWELKSEHLETKTWKQFYPEPLKPPPPHYVKASMILPQGVCTSVLWVSFHSSCASNNFSLTSLLTSLLCFLIPLMSNYNKSPESSDLRFYFFPCNSQTLDFIWTYYTTYKYLLNEPSPVLCHLF